MFSGVVGPFSKSVTHEPGVGVISTVSTPVPTSPKACTVLTGLQATVRAGAAVESTDLLIRDGASGSGTVIKRLPLAAIVNGVDRVWLSALQLASSPGNAITAEFSPAPTGTGFQSVSLDYYQTDAMSNSQQYGN